MRSSSQRINIAASSQRVYVDNRIPIRNYYRIADNILRQADIFRGEKNIIDLYVMLLRFSSLVVETIPCHQDYKASSESKKDFLKKRLSIVMSELEKLKPLVKQELDTKFTKEANFGGHLYENNSVEWSTAKKPTLSAYNVTKAVIPAPYKLRYQGLGNQNSMQASQVEEIFRRMSVNFPFPKEETLSKHSILGMNGLNRQSQPPKNDKWVQYPSDIDLTPVEIPSLDQSIEKEPTMRNDHINSELGVLSAHSSPTPNDYSEKSHAHEPGSLISFEESEAPVHSDIIRQPSPPPVLVEVQDLIPALSSQVTDAECGLKDSSPNTIINSEPPLELHISTTMMESFMRLAKSNTNKNLETCGVLAGSLKNRMYFVTALIIPKQESTPNSCQATNEEEIFDVQDKQSLFPLGWIHTHPTQTCFMSSIDIHTQYSYQLMLPEAVAIVMAPTDNSKSHGIFRLTSPGGMSVIRHCDQRGFHPHDQPPDGGPIYKDGTDVYMNHNLKFDVIDLR